ncbi:MAG: HAD hydrolase family protein [Bacteroidaceae bacterium]|nr:HAD hydrolase family protein [Bacteroidaceae bacterium]
MRIDAMVLTFLRMSGMGWIPSSTVFALTQAKARGHKVFIATGRPPLIITNLGAIEHLIDGYVTINGALCYVGDTVVRCREIPNNAVRLAAQDAWEIRRDL